VALGGGAERWEIDLAVEISFARHENGETVATDLVCDMHGILDDADRQLVRERVALRIALKSMGMGVAA
jgi:hypothetical protein